MIPQHLDYRGRQSFLSNSLTWTNLIFGRLPTFGALNAGREIDDKAVLRGAQPSTKGSSIQTLRHMGVATIESGFSANSPVTRIKMDRVSIYANMIFESSFVVSNTSLMSVFRCPHQQTYMIGSESESRQTFTSQTGKLRLTVLVLEYIFSYARWQRGCYSTIGRKQPTYAFKCQDWDCHVMVTFASELGLFG